MKNYTIEQLKTLPWWKIRGEVMNYAAKPFRIKLVNLHPDETYSDGYVIQRGKDQTDRSVVCDPAKMDQIRHNGF